MKRIVSHISLILIVSVSTLYGQISPGKLSTAHAELEGIRNCTMCHDLGSKVSDAKCLECHTDIQSLLNANRGYHADPSVKRQDCFECHSEHHGRKFDMMRFDQDNFNHNLTGYELEGEHDVIDCKACHKPDNISDFDIRKREGTFLGLDQECLSCHEDYHQKTLSSDCISCHNIEAFRPAPGFDHDEADFQLRGEHVNVDCKECHAETIKNGKSFQEFADVPFAACIDCHDDPHEQKIPGACTQCHNENSFNTFLGQRRFNHNKTGFRLKGSHASEDCFSCHAKTNNPLSVFQDQKNVAENNCVACHEDVHTGKYGQDCAKCHTEESFLTLKDMDFFDHSVTDYPLEGLHIGVDCRECHTERFSTPIDFSACKNCHEDYHEGEFVQQDNSPDCIQCHSLEHSFEYTSYSIEEHQKSTFPLEGAHIATPCFACHISEEEDRWTFKQIGTECIDCHEDIHQSYISDKFYPDQACASCHGNDNWVAIEFDHELTDWPLTGKHEEVDCRACHFEDADNASGFVQKFKDLSGDCISCHENVHDDTFAINGVTDCTRCHVTTSWLPEKFDHSTTAFPLEGQHAQVDCRACHELEAEDGTTTLVYKIEKFACIDCHQ